MGIDLSLLRLIQCRPRFSALQLSKLIVRIFVITAVLILPRSKSRVTLRLTNVWLTPGGVSQGTNNRITMRTDAPISLSYSSSK